MQCIAFRFRPKRIKQCNGPATQSENEKATKCGTGKTHFSMNINSFCHILLWTKLISPLVAHTYRHWKMPRTSIPVANMQMQLIQLHTQRRKVLISFWHVSFSFEIKTKQNFAKRNLNFNLKKRRSSVENFNLFLYTNECKFDWVKFIYWSRWYTHDHIQYRCLARFLDSCAMYSIDDSFYDNFHKQNLWKLECAAPHEP